MKKKLKLLSYPLIFIQAIVQLACVTYPSINGKIVSPEKEPPYDEMYWTLFYECKGDRINFMGYRKQDRGGTGRYTVRVKGDGSFKFSSRSFVSLLMRKEISMESALHIRGQKSPVFDYSFESLEPDADSERSFTLDIGKKKIEIFFSDSTREKIIKALKSMDYTVDDNTYFKLTYSSGYYSKQFKFTLEDLNKMNSIVIDDYMAWPHLDKTISDHFTLIMEKHSRQKGIYYHKPILDHTIEMDPDKFREDVRWCLDDHGDYKKFYSIMKRRFLSKKLMEAIEGNNYAAAGSLLKQGADANFKDDRNTPLFSAIEEQNLSLVRLLLSSGARTDLTVDIVHYDDCTPLESAMIELCEYREKKPLNRWKIKNAESIADAIITRTGTIPKDSRALSMACEINKFDYVKRLMDMGADANSGDRLVHGDLLPVQGAAKNGNLRIMKYLVAHGANADPKCRVAELPLSLAAGGGHFHVVKYLVEAGLDDKVLALAIPGAIDAGNIDIVRYLVEKGADIKTKNPLDRAAHKGDLEIVRYLVERGAKIDFSGSLGDAAAKGNYEVVKYLTEKGACSYEVNRGLKEAIGHGHADIVKYLAEHGADIITTLSLDHAIRNNRLKIAEYLIGRGIDLNAPQQNLRDRGTSMHYAAWQGKQEAITLLFKHGARFDVKDIDGNTPFHLAARFDRFEAVKFMVKHGADMTVRNNSFKSVISIATGESREYLEGIREK